MLAAQRAQALGFVVPPPSPVELGDLLLRRPADTLVITTGGGGGGGDGGGMILAPTPVNNAGNRVDTPSRPAGPVPWAEEPPLQGRDGAAASDGEYSADETAHNNSVVDAPSTTGEVSQ